MLNLNWTKKALSDFYQNGTLHLRVSVAQWFPWMGIHMKDNKVESIYGHLSEMLNILSSYMNFSFSLVTPADRQWGAPVGDGNWTGMIGMLQRDEADIAMGPFAITYLRAQVVDFTHLFTSNYLAVMGGRLKDHHPSFFSYILTFGWEIWLGIFLSWTTLSFGMTLVDVVHNMKWRSWEKAKSRYMYHFWIYFSNIFCESSPTIPTKTSARILVLVWWLAIIVLMNGFSGNLKAKMMTEEEIPRIESIKDVLSRNYIQPYIMRGSAYETYIKNTHTEEFQQFWRKIVSTNGRVLEEMYSYQTLRKVLRTEVVVVNDYWSMQDALARKCADLSEGLFYFGNQHFFQHPFAMAVNKRLPKKLANEISKRVNWVFESNIVSRWAARTNYNWTLCTQQDENQEEKPLTLIDLEGFFILYLLISALCIVSLILENIGSWLPWVSVEDREDEIHINGGYMQKVLNVASQFARFNYTILVPVDKQWGTPLPNGSFTGSVGMLSRNESDVCLGPLTITYERQNIVSFSKLFLMMHLVILGGNKKQSSDNVFGYILTFDWQVWVLMLVSLILTVITSSFIEYVLESQYSRMVTFKSNLIRYFWYYLGTVFFESMPSSSRFVSVRLVLAVWWIAVIVLTNGFSSNMKAKMLLRSEPKRIDSLQDLIDRPHIRPIIMKSTAYETYLKSSTSETIQKLWKIIKKNNGLIYANEMYSKKVLEEVADGKSVYIADPVSLKYFIGKNCMDMNGRTFYFSRETFHPHLFAMAYRKDMPKFFVKHLNVGLRKLFDGGVFYKMADRIDHDFEKCTAEEIQRGEKTLHLEDLFGIFILYLMFSGVSIIVFLMEYFIKVRKRKKSRKCIKSIKK